jgi:hypothetical protein
MMMINVRNFVKNTETEKNMKRISERKSARNDKKLVFDNKNFP